jgi:hypothetical protein
MLNSDPDQLPNYIQQQYGGSLECLINGAKIKIDLSTSSRLTMFKELKPASVGQHKRPKKRAG